MARYQVRRAELVDRARIRSLVGASEEDRWSVWLASPSTVVLIATADEVLVGVAQCGWDGVDGWISATQVALTLENYATVVRLLLTGALAPLRDAGAQTARALVYGGDADSLALFTGSGWAESGALRRFTSDPNALPDLTAPATPRQADPAELERIWGWLEQAQGVPLMGGVTIVADHPRALTDDLLREALHAGRVWLLEAWDTIQAVALATSMTADTWSIGYLDGAAQAVGELALALRARAGDSTIEIFTADLLISIDALNGAGFIADPEPLLVVERSLRR